MKLKSILKTLALSQLQTIEKHWGIHPMHFEPSLSDKDMKNQLVEYLYPRLQIGQYFMGVYDRLGMGEKDLLFFLAIHGGDIAENEVLERFFENNPERMELAITTLTNKGLVFYDKSEKSTLKEHLIGIPEPFLRYVNLPSYWQGYLGFYLIDLTAPQLKKMAQKSLKIRTSSNRKNVLIVLIRRHLLNPKKLRQYIQSLGDNEREIFRQIADRKGVCIYRDLLDSGYQKHYDHSKAEYIDNLLNKSGLVFTSQHGENKYNNLLMIPRDIYYIIDKHYKADLRPLHALDTTRTSKDKPPAHIMDNSNNLLRDMVIVASYINHNTVKPLATGGFGKNDLKKIVPFVSANKTPKYIGFIVLFMIEQKFLIPVGQTWRVNNTFLGWLDQGLNCYRDVFRFWLYTKHWNEEFIDGNVQHSDAAPSNLINAPEMRKMILKNLSTIPYTRWINFDSFSESLAPQIDMSIPRRGGGQERHQRHISLILESVIAESLYWMGIETLGIDENVNFIKLGNRTRQVVHTAQSRHIVFQITELGRFILEGPYETPEKLFEGRDTSILPLQNEVKTFTVQPNLEIITPPDLQLRSFYHLNEFCQIKTIDMMSTLIISRESLREGMDRGLSGEEILQFLSDSCPQGVPETVRHLIHECSDKHGELRMGFAGGYIRVTDRILLEELKSQKKVRPHIKDLFDEKMILLQPEIDVRKLARELQKLGFMPQLDSENVHMTSEGKYNVSLNQEELYTLIATLRFVGNLDAEMGEEIAQSEVSPLLERIKPDSAKAYNISYFADSVCMTLQKRFDGAMKKKINTLLGKYKRQVGRLLTTMPRQRAATPNATLRFSFGGANPATRKSDVLDLLDYANENDNEVEIEYERKKGGSKSYRISPKEVSNEKIYAFIPQTGRHSNFYVERIAKAELCENGS